MCVRPKKDRESPTLTYKPQVFEFIQSLPKSQGKPLSDILPDTNSKGILHAYPKGIYSHPETSFLTLVAINLLENMLVFDPLRRVSASEALEFAYFAPYHDPSDEPDADKVIDRAFDTGNHSADAWKRKL